MFLQQLFQALLCLCKHAAECIEVLVIHCIIGNIATQARLFQRRPFNVEYLFNIYEYVLKHWSTIPTANETVVHETILTYKEVRKGGQTFLKEISKNQLNPMRERGYCPF